MGIFSDIIYILQDGFELGIIWALLALGVFISFRILDFADLSVEGSITLGSVITASILLKTNSIALAVVLSLIGGLITGLVTGILHTKFKIPAILAGIISMTALYAINLKILGKASETLSDVNNIFTLVNKLFDNYFVTTLLVGSVGVILISLILYYLFGTKIGMSIRATGMNSSMAKAQGINTDLMVILGLALSNGIIALAGSLIAQSTQTSNLELGRGTIVIGLASIIIGEVLFGKRNFKNWLISVILGSIMFQLLISIALELGLDPNLLKLIQAVLIAVILALPEIRKMFKNRKGDINVKA